MAGVSCMWQLFYLAAFILLESSSASPVPSPPARFDPFYYMAKYPTDWLEIARRNSVSAKNWKSIAVGLGKRVAPVESSAPGSHSAKATEADAQFLREQIQSGLLSLSNANNWKSMAVGLGKRFRPDDSVQQRIHSPKVDSDAQNLREQIQFKLFSLTRPIVSSEELATQLRDDPRLAKAVIDAWIDTNNDGVITGSEILGRK